MKDDKKRESLTEDSAKKATGRETMVAGRRFIDPQQSSQYSKKKEGSERGWKGGVKLPGSIRGDFEKRGILRARLIRFLSGRVVGVREGRKRRRKMASIEEAEKQSRRKEPLRGRSVLKMGGEERRAGLTHVSRQFGKIGGCPREGGKYVRSRAGN